MNIFSFDTDAWMEPYSYKQAIRALLDPYIDPGEVLNEDEYDLLKRMTREPWDKAASESEEPEKIRTTIQYLHSRNLSEEGNLLTSAGWYAVHYRGGWFLFENSAGVYHRPVGFDGTKEELRAILSTWTPEDEAEWQAWLLAKQKKDEETYYTADDLFGDLA